MRPFDTIVIVDWSSGNDRGATPKKDAIWAAVASQDMPQDPVYLRNRQVAQVWLTELFTREIRAGRRVLAGFDFPFGYPAGFAQAITGHTDPLVLWDHFAHHLYDSPGKNNRFALAAQLNARLPGHGPFWFNALPTPLPDLPHKKSDRRGQMWPEFRLAEAQAPGTFSCWQMGGAGSVGGQAMTGQAVLGQLRAAFRADLRVWPFEPITDAAVVLAEVWPSLLRDQIKAASRKDEIKDACQTRVLAAALWQMQSDVGLAQLLDDVPELGKTQEGWILGLAQTSALRAAATKAIRVQPTPFLPKYEIQPMSTLIPPRLRNDCFAMPQGVAWVPVDVALERLRANLHAVCPIETLPTSKALGRFLAQDALALRANPPAANAAVDGYGFAHAATTADVQRLPLLAGRAAAGQPFLGAVPSGAALRILTGAILPDGVDTVVLEEDCAVGDGLVVFDGPVKARINTRRAGEDMQAGQIALPAGHQLRAPDLALLSALGVAQVSVFRPLRVGVLSTGDELITAPALPTGSHQIYDANRPMLLGLAQSWGFTPVDLGHVCDDPTLIAAALDHGATAADVILTSGGASAGDEDHVSALLRTRGQLSSWRIAMKPGRPLALALWDGVPVFGLPGNPVAAFVCALIFARPACLHLAGGRWQAPNGFQVPAAFTKSKKAGRREYLRARLTEDGRAEVFASEGSGRISGLSWAEGLVELPDAAAEITPGDVVRFLPYGSFGI